MSSQKTTFLQALRLPPDLADEACTRAVSELVSLAATDASRPVSLRHIHDAVSRYDCATYLEPLDVLPTVLPCHQDGAMDLIRTCASNSSPKEVMIVIQEAIEHLQTRLNDQENQADEYANDPDLVQRVIRIVSLCSPAISRSRLGKQSALALCSPVLQGMTSLIDSAASFGTSKDGRELVVEVAHLVQSLSVWWSTVTDADGQHGIMSLLRALLDTTVMSYAPSIQASLAIRAAKHRFPRVFFKSSAKEGWQDGEGAMIQVQLALEYLGDALQQIRRKPSSLSDVIYLAHSTPLAALSTSAASDLERLVVRALQMNVIVDESLYLLFRILTEEDTRISPDVATSLCTVLTALASTHLDPTIRQLNLRLLSLALTKLPAAPRLETLLRLATDEEFPQIRGPAIGLVKEAVLEALALPLDHASRNPFGSPEFLRVFGRVLFRPTPPEFFSERKSREEIARSLELLRIADCLSFYYVLLQRDSDNRTGVRSQSNVTGVRHSLLEPLRRFLDEHVAGEEQPLMAMSSLQIGLDRIDSALGRLDK